MAEKANIDLLGIDKNEENGASNRDGIQENAVPDAREEQAVKEDQTANEDQVAKEEQTVRIHVLMRLLKTAKRKYLLILVISVLVITVAGGSIWLFYGGERKKEPAMRKNESAIKEKEPAIQGKESAIIEKKSAVIEKKSAVIEEESLKKAIPAAGKMVLFNNFVVDARDKKGDMRIAFCDIVIELENPQAAGVEGERGDVRSVIHAVLKRKQVVDGLSSEGRGIIKIELINELNRLLGEKTVKNIYITHLEVI